LQVHLASDKFAAQFVEPVVFKELIKSDTFFGLLDQHSGQQVQTVATVMLPLRGVKSQFVFACHPNRLLLTVVVEGQRRAQKSVNNAP
jgi:hypothetical protein